MTAITARPAAAAATAFGRFWASLPSVAEMVETAGVLSVAAFMTACLNVML